MWRGGIIVHAVIVVALVSLVPLPANAGGEGSLATNVDVGISLCGTAPINYTVIFPASADLNKPHVISFFRTSNKAVSIIYEVKDAKGGEVIPLSSVDLPGSARRLESFERRLASRRRGFSSRRRVSSSRRRVRVSSPRRRGTTSSSAVAQTSRRRSPMTSRIITRSSGSLITATRRRTYVDEPT